MKKSALAKYSELQTEREQFLDVGRRASRLTLPYLLVADDLEEGGLLRTPWQSVGARGCNVLASKMMLSLFPINTRFFKLQINDGELEKMPDVTPDVRSEIDLSLGKMERIIMQQIAESNDRVALHAAMKHLVVTGNALLYAGKKAVKLFPLDRYVVARDGDGNVMEIVTKEIVDRSLLPTEFQKPSMEHDSNNVGADGPQAGMANLDGGSMTLDQAVVYTYVTCEDGQHKWYQETDDKIIPGSKSSSPIKTSPWMPLRFNVANNGESYGRGRVEEFLGDLTSLEQLYKAMVQGSAAASKVVFMVSPSATTKPQSLANASSGAIIQGRPDDVGVVQVGKTADFKTVQEMIRDLTQRLSDAFLVLNVRHSDRTTATEIQATQMELNEQLGGIFSNLTHELLQPYLARKLSLAHKSKIIPTLPKGLVLPTVVAGLEGLGRGQDKVALIEFLGTISQAMGPEAVGALINPDEFLKRLAAASGIESLGLVKSQEQLDQEKQKAKEEATQQQVMGQIGQLAKSPMAEQMTQQMMPNDGTTEQSSEQAAPSPEA